MPEILDKYGLGNLAGIVQKPQPPMPAQEEESILDTYGLGQFKAVAKDVLKQIPAGIGRGIVEVGAFAGTPIIEAEKLVRTKLLGQDPEYVEEGHRLAKEELLDLFPKPETLPGEAVGGLAEFIPSAVSFGGPAKAGIKAIAPRVAKTLPRVAKALEATVPSASAFGGAEAVSDKDLLTRGEITPIEYLRRISIGAGLGATLGGIGKLPVRETLKFPVEVGAFAEASALERGEVTPTKEDALYSLIFLGGLKGLQAGITRLAERTGKPVEQVQQEVKQEAKVTGKSEQRVTVDKLQETELKTAREIALEKAGMPPNIERIPIFGGPQTEIPGPGKIFIPPGIERGRPLRSVAEIVMERTPAPATPKYETGRYVRYDDKILKVQETKEIEGQQQYRLGRSKQFIPESKIEPILEIPLGESVPKEIVPLKIPMSPEGRIPIEYVIPVSIRGRRIGIQFESSEVPFTVKGGERVAETQGPQGQEVLRPTTPIQPETPPPPSALGIEPQPGTPELPGATPGVGIKSVSVESPSPLPQVIPGVDVRPSGATALPREGITPIAQAIAVKEEIKKYIGVMVNLRGEEAKILQELGFLDKTQNILSAANLLSRIKSGVKGKQLKEVKLDLAKWPSLKEQLDLYFEAKGRPLSIPPIPKAGEGVGKEEMERNLQHFREMQGEMDAQTGEGIKRIAKETVAQSIAREAGVEPPPKGPTFGWSKTDVMAELLPEKSPERFAKRIGEGKGTAEETKAFDNFMKSASVTKNIANNLEKAPDGRYSSADVKKVRDTITDGLLGAYEPVSKISSEAGRMLQKIQKFKINAEQLERAFGDIPPEDIARWTEVIDRLKAIDIENNPQAFARFVKSIPNPKFMDYVYEYWYNSILSGLPTHLVNFINNNIWQAYQVPHKAVRGIVDKSLSVLTGKPREYYATEAWITTKIGIRRGIGRLAEMIRTRKFPTEYSKWEREIGPSIGAFERSPSRLLRGLAPVVTLPTKALRAEDIYFRSIAYDIEIASQAYKLARKGPPKEKFAERMAELLQNPTGEMIEKAGKYADYSVFMDAPGKITSTLLQLRDSVPGGRFVIPFVNTISNLLQRGLEMTPGVGLVLEKGKLGGPETADVITKQIMGGTLAYLATLYIDGLLTGAPPQDKAEREAFFRQGKLPWAVNINGIWYQYRRFEPFNTVLASVAELGDAWRDKGESPPEEQIVSIFTGLGKNLLDSSYLSTFADLISAIEKGDRASDSIKKMAQRQILSFSPFSSAQRSFVKAGEALEEGETKIRRPEGIMEALKAQTPGLSKEVTAKKDVFGREITLPGGAIRQALPFKASAEVPDLVESELQRLGIFPGTPGKKVSGLELSKEEYGKYVDLQGKATKILLNRAINSPNWPRLNDRARTKYIDAIIRTVRDEAGDKILEERVIKIRKTGMTPEQRKEVENLGLRRKHAPVGTRP